MKIDGTNKMIQLDAYMRQSRQSKPEANEQSKLGSQLVQTDKVQISQTALEAQRATQLSKESAEVREDLVQRIKLEVEAGRYAVPAEKTAAGMLREGFENDLILKNIDTRA